jgi:hypothetical protein
MKYYILKLYHSATFNTWTSFVSRALNLLVLTPFLLTDFLPSEISFWYLLATISGFTFMLEFGFGPSLIRSISYGLGGASSMKDKEASGKVNIDFLKKVWQNIRIIYLVLTFILFVTLLLFGRLAVLNSINSLPSPQEGWWAWYITIIGISILFFGNMYTIYLQGINKIALYRRYETVFSVCSVISCVIGIKLELNILGLIALSQMWNVITVLRNFWLCTKDDIFRKIKSKFTFRPDVLLLSDLWGTSWRSAVGMVMSYGIINSTSIYYAQSKNVTEVASFLFSYRILQMIVSFSMAPFYTKVPELSRLYITNNYVKLVECARQGMLFSHLTLISGAILCCLVAPPALVMLDSSVAFIDQKLWMLLTIAFFIERYGAMHMQLYSVSNIIIWHKANSVTGVILLILLFISVPHLNFYAFPISMIIAYLTFYSWYAPSKSLKLFKLNFFNFEFKTTILPFIVLLSFYAFLRWQS